MIVVSVCLPSDALSAPTGVSLTLDMGYLLLASAPDFGHGVAPHGLRSCPWTWGSSSRPLTTPAPRSRPCNPLIACVLGHASGGSQESAPVAVLFQPMGHAVWYRVRAAEVPADSEVSSLSLLVKKGKSLVLKRTKVWKSTGPTSQADKQDSPHLHSVHSENVILILYFNSLKTNYLFGCAGS